MGFKESPEGTCDDVDKCEEIAYNSDVNLKGFKLKQGFNILKTLYIRIIGEIRTIAYGLYDMDMNSNNDIKQSDSNIKIPIMRRCKQTHEGEVNIEIQKLN